MRLFPWGFEGETLEPMRARAYMKWVRVAARLVDREAAACPLCGSTEIQCRFIGELKTRNGYGYVWCGTCLKGVKLCGVVVAEHFDMYAWDDASAHDGLSQVTILGDETGPLGFSRPQLACDDAAA